MSYAHVSTALDSVRHGWQTTETHTALLAVADAVMELHQAVSRGRVMPCCAGCEEFNGDHRFDERCCHEWPCPTVEAVAEALKGMPPRRDFAPSPPTG